MARNRVIYQSQAVYASTAAYNGDLTANKTISGLQRVQSANYSFNIARQDVNQFGQLAAIDRIITDAPTVSFDTSYYVANFTNERTLGFTIAPSGAEVAAFKSAVTDIISTGAVDSQKNYFILTTKEGTDAVDDQNSGDYESIIGIGNGFITSYSTEASVGGLPTASVSVEGQNMNFVNLPYNGNGLNGGTTDPAVPANGFVTGVAGNLIAISGENPAVNPTDGKKVGKHINLPVASGSAPGLGEQATGFNAISTLRPGDITLTLSKKAGDQVSGISDAAQDMGFPDYAGASIADSHIQSFNLSFDLSRSPIQKLGNRFAFARAIDFPVNISLSVDAILSNLTSGSLADIIDCDDEFDAQISMKDPKCIPGVSDEGAGDKIICNYFLKGLKLDSQSFSAGIGDNKSVTLDFTSQIGGPEQSGHGIFMSGFYSQGDTPQTA
jgi:hypothetical protein